MRIRRPKFKTLLIVPISCYLTLLLISMCVLVIFRKDMVAYRLIEHGLKLPSLDWYFQ